METKRNIFGLSGIRGRILALILIVSLGIILILSVNVFVYNLPNLTLYQKSTSMEIFSGAVAIFLSIILMVRGFLELKSKGKTHWHLLAFGVFLAVGYVWRVSTLLPVVFGGN